MVKQWGVLTGWPGSCLRGPTPNLLHRPGPLAAPPGAKIPAVSNSLWAGTHGRLPVTGDPRHTFGFLSFVC